MPEKQFKNNLQKIISGSFVLLLIIVVLVVSYTTIEVARPVLVKNQQERVESLGNKIVARLSNSIVAAETIAISMASIYTGMSEKKVSTISEMVPDLLNLPGKSHLIAGGGLWPEPFLFDKNCSRRSFFWGRQADNNLQYFDDYNDPSGVGYHHEGWYVPARYAHSQKGIWSQSYVDPHSLQPMITCTIPMVKKGKFVGASTVDLKLEGLADLFAEAGRDLNGYLFALDRNDKFLAFPNPELIRKKDSHGKMKAALGFIDSNALCLVDKRFVPVCEAVAKINREIIEKAKEKHQYKSNIVEALTRESSQIDHHQAQLITALFCDPLKAETNSSKKLVSFRVQDDIVLHEPVTVTIFHMPATYWKIAVVVPESRIDGVVGQIVGRMIFCLIFVLLIILFASFFLLRIKLLRPLQKITTQLQHIEEEPQLDLLELDISSDNEFGRMAYHFNHRTRELTRSRKRYQDLFDNAKVAILVHDEAGKIIDVNQTMLDIYQIHDREIACCLSIIKDLSAPENNFTIMAEHWRKVLEGTTQEFEWQAKHYRDGTFFDVLVSLSRSLYDEQVVIISTVTDITEKLKNERELQKISRLEPLGLLAGGIAHDFNNLLSGIFGNISLARLQVSTESKVDGYLERAEKAMQKSTSLTRQLLTFAKGGEPVKEAVDVAQLVRDCAGFVTHGSNVKLKISCDSDLWRVFVDKGQIDQVVSNLVINADQAMSEGGTISITINNLDNNSELKPGLERGRYVRIVISDQGAGISAEHLGKIFDPYFTTKSTGCGLGLALCFSIIKKHHGFIRAESEAGLGTSFTIDLPVVVEAVIEKGESKSEPVTGKPGDCVKSLKILFMDDEPVLQEIAVEIITLMGHSVVVASEGREAVKIYTEAFQNNQIFDLIIVDLTIPGGMGGLETFTELRKLNPEIKAIVSSGYSTDPVMANYLEYGFVGVIAKPYLVNEVKKTLSRVAMGITN
ncbi:MAG: response regulator [Deltaproteobacteria bacterium]|nr:response regulator [Candidatus Tharpella sp.]